MQVRIHRFEFRDLLSIDLKVVHRTCERLDPFTSPMNNFQVYREEISKDLKVVHRTCERLDPFKDFQSRFAGENFLFQPDYRLLLKAQTDGDARVEISINLAGLERAQPVSSYFCSDFDV